MNILDKRWPALLAAAAAGAGLTLLLYRPVSPDPLPSSEVEREPLYWVAPMDASYRRAGPGKSPMGMDLVPVYADESAPASGEISIAPGVINTLGVRSETITRRRLETPIRTVGYVRYDEDSMFHIHPRVEGWLEKLHVKAEGDPVTAGEPLYELYAPELVNAQEEMLLALKRGDPRLVDAAQERLSALQLSPEFIEELKVSRQVRQHITFRASQGGVVDNLNIREGFYVEPGTTLMSIGALDQVWVEAEVFERQAALVAVGLPVTMTLDYLPGREWRGRVDYLYPALDAQTRTLRVRLRFDNKEGLLRPNMFAQVTIHAGRGEPVLVAPREAIIRTGRQDRVVLALGEGRFRSVPVTLGHVGDSGVQILEGLETGDRVVVSAQFLLDSESSKRAEFRRMGADEPAAVDDEGHRHD